MSVTVVTYANEMKQGAINYKLTLDRLGYNYQFLGAGEKWNGFMTKINAYLKYVSSVDPDTIIAVTDSYDVLAVGSPSELMTKWLMVNKPILFSAERKSGINNCTSLNDYWNDIPRPLNQFLNSGFFMGRAIHLKQALEYAVSSKENDDQYAMCLFADAFPSTVELDVQSNIIGTILPIDTFEYKLTTNGVTFIIFRPIHILCLYTSQQITQTSEHAWIIMAPGYSG